MGKLTSRASLTRGFFVGDMYYWEDDYNDSPYGLHQFQIEKIPLVDYTEPDNTIDILELSDSATAIQNILVNHLTLEDAEILRLHYGIERKSHNQEQLADIIGISQVAVHKRLRKALNNLKAVIQTSYPELI